MKNPKVIASLILIVLVAIVALQNTDEVATKVLWMTITMPRILLLMLVCATGFLGGFLIARSRASRNA